MSGEELTSTKNPIWSATKSTNSSWHNVMELSLQRGLGVLCANLKVAVRGEWSDMTMALYKQASAEESIRLSTKK